jgi:hypothetical protein
MSAATVVAASTTQTASYAPSNERRRTSPLITRTVCVVKCPSLPRLASNFLRLQHTLCPNSVFCAVLTLLKINDLSHIFLRRRSGWRPISPGLTRLETASISTRPADRLTKANRLAEPDDHPGLATSGLTCQITAGGNSQIQELLI